MKAKEKETNELFLNLLIRVVALENIILKTIGKEK